MADQNRTHKNGGRKGTCLLEKEFSKGTKINQKLKIIIHPCQKND